MTNSAIEAGEDAGPALTSRTRGRVSRRGLAIGAAAALLSRIDVAAGAPGTEVSVKPIRRSAAVVRSALSTSTVIEVTTDAPSIATVAVTPRPSGRQPRPSGPATQHQITVTGLDPQTVYDFAVKTRPAAGKRSVVASGATGASGALSGTLVSAPPGDASMTVSVVDPPMVSTIGDRAGIRWQTNILTNGRIETWPYGTDGDERTLVTSQWFETPTKVGRFAIESATTEHRICMERRKPGRTYGFNIGCASGANEVNWGERWFRQARRAPSGMLPYRPGARAVLPTGVSGLLALPGGQLLTFSGSGALTILDTANGFRTIAAWNAGLPVAAAASDAAGRIYLALTDRRREIWNCRCSHAIVDILAPDAQSPTGYTQTSRLGMPGGVTMPGEPTAVALDSFGNLHVATIASSGGTPATTVHLFAADPSAPTGFTDAGTFPIPNVTAMAAGANGTMYFLSGARSIIAAIGGLLAPAGSPVTEWNGSSLGGGAWILGAGLCAGGSGSFFVIDGCLGGAQKVTTNDFGAFRMFAVWQTRGTGRPKVEQPAGITAAADGNVYVLDARARNGRPAVVQFRPDPVETGVAGRWVPQPAAPVMRSRAPRESSHP